MRAHPSPFRAGALLLAAGLLAACSAPSAPAPAPAAKPPAASAPAPASAPAAVPAAPAPTRDALEATRLPQRARVVVGAPSGAALHVYIGIERGHFEALNVDIHLEDRLSSAETVAHLTSGDVDVANTSVAPGVFNAFVRGLPLKIAIDQTRYATDGKSHVVLARQELHDSGQLRGVEQLRGRRVALTTPGSGLGIDLDRALRRVGMTLDDVDQVQLQFIDQPVALANGSIDAAVTFYPLASHATERQVATPIRYLNEDYPEHQIAVTLIGTRMRERPEVMRAFTVGFLRSARDYERARRFGENVDEIAAAIAKHSRLDPGVVAGYLRGGQMTAVDPDGRVNLDSIRYDLQWYRERAFVDADVNVADFVDLQFADYALGVLGPFR
jgi:ABC-type nitrate/sulfonate/bicarbonate transport system substrate-binding protein